MYKNSFSEFKLGQRVHLRVVCLSLHLSFCVIHQPLSAATDLQFARTHDGRPVPYATAGDCYSAAKCPQVFDDSI